MQKARIINIDSTINSGQVFLWRKVEDQWVGIDGPNIIVLRDTPFSARSSSHNVGNFLREDDNLEKILANISKDETVKKAVKKSPGLRLIRQDPFQCYISFICSSNSSIQNIKSALVKICNKFGNKVDFDGHSLNVFPSAERLAKASIKELLDCGLGFRAKYVKKASEAVHSRDIDFDWLKKTDYNTAMESLKEIDGIGNKVAECILLFSLDKMEAFPIDRWVQRILSKYYQNVFDKISEKPLTEKQYESLHYNIEEYFGPYAGYSQQFLFKMERDLNKKNWL